MKRLSPRDPDEVDLASATITLSVVIVVLVSIAAGPFFGIVSIPSDVPSSSGAAGLEASGTAELTLDSTPSEFRLERAEFGAGVYVLKGGDSTVTVDSIEGSPVIEYRLEIPALGYTSVRKYFLSNESVGKTKLTFLEGRFSPDSVTKNSYRGTLSITLYGDRTRTLLKRNVTISVVE